jgi:hypothetical protein
MLKAIFADELLVHRLDTIFQLTKSIYVRIATRVIMGASYARYKVNEHYLGKV